MSHQRNPRFPIVMAKLSASAKAAREPLPIEWLTGARFDRVHRDPGRGRAARVVRVRRPDRLSTLAG